MSRTALLGALFLFGSAALAPEAGREQRAPASPLEGKWEYVGTLKGQAILTGGRFVFLYGPVDGSAPMIGDAGTYQIKKDTAWSTIRYSTVTQRVGVGAHWAIQSWSGDTAAYVVWNDAGQVTGRGRAVRRR